uniref:Putative secreted protein n=1 Tax=Ixodes ricinus TaxID=34613 RepID=A0A6B0UZB5_IXORI
MRTHLRPWLWASCTYSLHAFIMAVDVMRKRVARSLTARTRAAASGPGPPSSCSRSVRERCSAVPCLAMRSLHIDRSSSLTCSRRNTVSSSLLSSWLGMSSSSSSSDSIMRTALALASSRAVTHFWRSISLLAFRWNVCVPPLEMTKLHESSVWITALTRLMVPRQVCAISAWFL